MSVCVLQTMNDAATWQVPATALTPCVAQVPHAACKHSIDDACGAQTAVRDFRKSEPSEEWKSMH